MAITRRNAKTNAGKFIAGFQGMTKTYSVPVYFRDGRHAFNQNVVEPIFTEFKQNFEYKHDGIVLKEGNYANNVEIQPRSCNNKLRVLVRDWKPLEHSGDRRVPPAYAVNREKKPMEKGAFLGVFEGSVKLSPNIMAKAKRINVPEVMKEIGYTYSRPNYIYKNTSVHHHRELRIPYVIGRESHRLTDGHWLDEDLLVCISWLNCEWDAVYRMREFLKMKYKDIASILGRTYASVQCKVDKARNQKVDEDGTNAYHLIGLNGHWKRWHWFEVDILASMRSKGYSFETIAIALGRTEMAVRVKARQEGIK